MLLWAAVVDGDDDGAADGDEAETEGFVEVCAGGGVGEDAAVEEEDDRGRLRQERLEDVVDDWRRSVGVGGSAGAAVDAVEKWGGAWEEEVGGEDAVFRVSGGGDLAVQKLGEAKVESAVGVPEKLVGELEVGYQN